MSRGVTLTPTLTLALTKCVLECVAAWNARVCSSVCWSACGSVECAAALQPCTPIYACRRPARAACGLGAGVFAPPTPKGMYASGSHGRTPADIGLTTGNKKERPPAGLGGCKRRLPPSGPQMSLRVTVLRWAPQLQCHFYGSASARVRGACGKCACVLVRGAWRLGIRRKVWSIIEVFPRL